MLITKAPNAVIAVCVTTVIITTLICVTLLVTLGKNPHDLFNILSALFSGGSLLLSGGAYLYAGASAKRANDSAVTVEGLSNGELSQKIQDALSRHDAEVHGMKNGSTTG